MGEEAKAEELVDISQRKLWVKVDQEQQRIEEVVKEGSREFEEVEVFSSHWLLALS